MKPVQVHNVWETMWSYYDEPTYCQVLSLINHDDIVLEIGAGDLRLARRIAQKCQRIYAIELQYNVLKSASDGGRSTLLDNLYVVCGDAIQLPFPADVSTSVLLMRHCNHFRLYAEKLKGIGARRLITNARWGLDIEIVYLQQPRKKYNKVSIGEYACWCGATGFIPGPVDMLSPSNVGQIHEVIDCPQCF
jgi:hypothetical protein